MQEPKKHSDLHKFWATLFGMFKKDYECVCAQVLCVSMLALYTQGKHRVEKMWTMSLNYTSEDIGDTALPVMHHLKAAMELIRVTTNDS